MTFVVKDPLEETVDCGRWWHYQLTPRSLENAVEQTGNHCKGEEVTVEIGHKLRLQSCGLEGVDQRRPSVTPSVMVDIVSGRPKPLKRRNGDQDHTLWTEEVLRSIQGPYVVVQMFDDITKTDAIKGVPFKLGERLDGGLANSRQATTPTEFHSFLGEIKPVHFPMLACCFQEVAGTASDIEEASSHG